MTGAAKQTTTTSSKLRTAVARHSGWRQRSPGRYTCHELVIRMCDCSVIPPSNRISRCLPFGSSASTRWPLRRAMAAGRTSVTTLPAMRRRNATAVRQIVSPSGKDGPALGPEDHAFRRGAEPGFAQHAFQRRVLDGCAVDALDLQLVDPCGDRCERVQMLRLHLAGGEQRPST